MHARHAVSASCLHGDHAILHGMADWDAVRFFLELARAKTLARAARTLRVDYTTVGRRISAFERELGAKLFERTPDGFVLTPAGESLRAAAEQMEQSALAVEQRALGVGGAYRTRPDGDGLQFVAWPADLAAPDAVERAAVAGDALSALGGETLGQRLPLSRRGVDAMMDVLRLQASTVA